MSERVRNGRPTAKGKAQPKATRGQEKEKEGEKEKVIERLQLVKESYKLGKGEVCRYHKLSSTLLSMGKVDERLKVMVVS